MLAFADVEGVPAVALDDTELRAHLLALGRERALLDAREADAIAELDLRGAFLHDGAANTKAWLAHETGVAAATAGSRVRLAKCLRRMPLIAIALARGQVTDGHCRSMARCLTPRTLVAFARDEATLTSAACALDAEGFDLAVTRWLFMNDPDGPEPACERGSQLHTSPLLGGRTRIDGELDPEDSIEFLTELQAIDEELWHADQAADDTDPLKGRSHAERNAAALVEMARRSSAAGDRDADPDSPAARPGPRRPQIIAVADLAALNGDPTGMFLFDAETPASNDILQRWLCDTAIGRVIMAGQSVPIDLGRSTYTTSPGQRRALIARDRGCMIPGCKRKARWCDAHHVVPFPNGPTNLDNLVLLCKRHHKHVHQQLLKLVWEPVTERWVATRPDGTRLRERPPPLP